MKRFLTATSLPLTAFIAGLALLAPGGARAAGPTAYKIQAIARIGDKIGGTTAGGPNGGFTLGALNDRGQLVLGVGSPIPGEMLVEYTGGHLQSITVPGQPAPDGTWPTHTGILDPASINQKGDVVFATGTQNGGGLGTYLWDDQTQKITVVVAKGMPAVNNLTFQSGGDWFPTINDRGEIAFPAAVKNAAGAAHLGAFLRSPEGQFQAVALPDQVMPGSDTLVGAGWPVINNSGAVAFYGVTTASPNGNAYLWANGTLTRLLQANTAAPGGGTFAGSGYALVNNANQNVLIGAGLKGLDSCFVALYLLIFRWGLRQVWSAGTTGPADERQEPRKAAFGGGAMTGRSAPACLDPNPHLGGAENKYLWENGQLKAVAIPGQEMPGGGKLKGAFDVGSSVSFANGLGQYAFVAALADGSSSAYRIDTDGSLSLILKSGMTTDLGVITDVGVNGYSGGIALNSQGQVATTVQIKGMPETLVLLTPVLP